MARERAKPLRTALIVAVAVLLATLSVRHWSSRAPISHPLSALGALWPGHPEVATKQLLVQSALAARAGRPFSPAQRRRVRELAISEPLGPQPFLIEGAIAQLEGDLGRATRLYRAARLRDPRDPAARILLAELQLQGGLVQEGLANLIALNRIQQNAVSPLAPALAKYAVQPGAPAEVRRVLAREPGFAEAVLQELAADPANTGLILSIAPSLAPAPWQDRLIEATLTGGRPVDARRLWGRFNKARGQGPGAIFNPGFEETAARPPFNWALSSGNGGVAEYRAGGGLTVAHFGREPMILARQLLLLEPGRYVLRTEVEGTLEPGQLQWKVHCFKGGEEQMIPLAPSGAPFTIPAGCPAHWLELHGIPQEGEKQVSAVLTRVSLARGS